MVPTIWRLLNFRHFSSFLSSVTTTHAQLQVSFKAGSFYKLAGSLKTRFSNNLLSSQKCHLLTQPTVALFKRNHLLPEMIIDF